MSIQIQGKFTNLLANYEREKIEGDFTCMCVNILVMGVMQVKFIALLFLQTSTFAYNLGNAK